MFLTKKSSLSAEGRETCGAAQGEFGLIGEGEIARVLPAGKVVRQQKGGGLADLLGFFGVVRPRRGGGW
jgi:hypothetical protein